MSRTRWVTATRFLPLLLLTFALLVLFGSARSTFGPALVGSLPQGIAIGSTPGPAKPFTIFSARDGSRVDSRTVTVRGAGEPGAEVFVTQPIPPYKLETLVDEHGRWAIPVALTAGEHTIRLTYRVDDTVEQHALRVIYQPPWVGPLTVEALPLGKGEALLIKRMDETVLIDGGEHGEGIVAALRARDVRSIDLLVATHSHSDHIGGLVEVLDAMPVAQVVYSGRKVSDGSRFFYEAVRRSGAAYQEPKRGQVLTAGSLRFEVLNPPTKSHLDENNNSIVLRLRYGSRSFLFTGDASVEAERNMLASGLNLRADVLKLGHHGSGDASSLPFVNAVAPKIAIYSGGHDGERRRIPEDRPEMHRRLEQLGITVYGAGTLLVTDGKYLRAFPR